MSLRRLLLLFCLFLPPSATFGTALDDYINTPDPNYRYEVENVNVQGDALSRHTLYTVKLYSQQWRDASEVNHPVWEHWLTVAVPEQPRTKLGLLVIAGGGIGSDPPRQNKYTDILVGETGAFVALLQQVPNQPLIFSDDGTPRVEDEIIAYSYDKFMETGDPAWPALLPMTKSAVRALDTIEEIVGDAIALDGFVVGGGSKRGWTTWLTAAVDPRVTAIVPIVIDVLQMDVQMAHHRMAYGAYSEAVQEYVDENIFDRFLTPRGQALLDIVDPYEYRDRLAMPKLLVNATGDEFFVLDSSRYYWDDLIGPKWLRYVTNSGHGIEADMSTLISIVQFFKAVSTGERLPRYEWTFEDDGSIRVTTDGTENRVRFWQATNPCRATSGGIGRRGRVGARNASSRKAHGSMWARCRRRNAAGPPSSLSWAIRTGSCLPARCGSCPTACPTMTRTATA